MTMINGVKLSELSGLSSEDLIAAMILTNPDKVTVTTWSDAELTAIKSDAVIADRHDRLFKTDWWATSDRTMTAEQTAYRQALRDITEQEGFPTDITWPTKPEGN